MTADGQDSLSSILGTQEVSDDRMQPYLRARRAGPVARAGKKGFGQGCQERRPSASLSLSPSPSLSLPHWPFFCLSRTCEKGKITSPESCVRRYCPSSPLILTLTLSRDTHQSTRTYLSKASFHPHAPRLQCTLDAIPDVCRYLPALRTRTSLKYPTGQVRTHTTNAVPATLSLSPLLPGRPGQARLDATLQDRVGCANAVPTYLPRCLVNAYDARYFALVGSLASLLSRVGGGAHVRYVCRLVYAYVCGAV
ncbi:hypothetical protein LX36DRAFT_136028 [Colletotrichum falcatum]|nr:hypothetical protein LX36DRAFT_136028 [Colletotrichum falcatum]